MPEQSRSVSERLARLDTAILCDVFDEFGWSPPALDSSIQLTTTTDGPVVGFAYTIEGQLTHGEGPDRSKLKAVDETPDGCIAVWSGVNAHGICLFGDLLAAKMQANGCRGAVVDGGFRDRRAIGEMGFPVYARYTSPVQSVGRWRVTRVGEAVVLPSSLGGLLTIHPGDWIVADQDGVVALPRDRAAEVLDRAEAIMSDEAEARRLAAEGLSTQQMLERFGHV
ncbi:MAG: RraA family protein [Trueperaceae bacterium]